MSTSDLNSVMERLKATYLESVTEKLHALSDAIAARDFKEIIRHGHQLKGSGRSYGFAEISEIGARIEEAGHGHQGPVLETALIELERVIERLNPSKKPTVHS